MGRQCKRNLGINRGNDELCLYNKNMLRGELCLGGMLMGPCALCLFGVNTHYGYSKRLFIESKERSSTRDGNVMCFISVTSEKCTDIAVHPSVWYSDYL